MAKHQKPIPIASKFSPNGLIEILEDLLAQARGGQLRSILYVGESTDGLPLWGRSNHFRDSMSVLGASAYLQKRCLELVDEVTETVYGDEDG